MIHEIVSLRHELHQHPEVRFEERWTSERICRFLDEVGIPYKTGYCGGTGIVATLDGDFAGRTIGLRSDIDALEVQELTGLPYASTTANRMHACGHDGHMACLCGTAKVLAAHRDLLHGTVRFIFQPAEELGNGGERMVGEGILDGVDAVFALHGWPGIAPGSIGVLSGPMMASADWFRVEVKGRGCHGADPAAGIDPVLVAAHITTALQSIVSREIDPRNPAVLTVARINAGVATNIIPETATIEGTFRTLNSSVRDHILEAIPRVAGSVASAFRASASVLFGENRYIPLVNDPCMTDFVRDTVREALGENVLVELTQPSMASEDFAFYLEKVPGSYVRLGVGGNRKGTPLSLHSAYFDFNDEALEAGVRLFSFLAVRFLSPQ